MNFTLEEMKKLADEHPDVLCNLLGKSGATELQEQLDNEPDSLEEDYEDEDDEDNYYHDDCDDDYDCEDDYEDEDDEDYNWPQETKSKCVVTSTSSRVSIFVNDDSYAFDIKEVPSSIAHIIKRLLNPSSDTDMSLSSDEITLIKNARVPKLARFINKASDNAIIVNNNRVELDGDEINNDNIDFLLSMADSNDADGIRQFVKFQRSLERNASAKIIRRLLDFIKCNSIDIDKSGNIIAYKAVKSDLYDCYTGNTFLNEPGAVIEMSRGKVNDDDTETCSTGLHVCSIGYLQKCYWSSSSKLAIVSIRPEDFVSIPVDYNDAKARVCKYTVLRICETEEAEKLLNMTIGTDDDRDDDDYEDEYVDFSNFL